MDARLLGLDRFLAPWGSDRVSPLLRNEVDFRVHTAEATGERGDRIDVPKC